MKCERAIDLLSPYLDGELSRRRADAVRAHLDVCGSCRAEFQALARLSALYRELPEPELPADFEARVRKTVAQRSERVGVIERIERLLAALRRPAFAYGGVAALLIVGLWLTNHMIDEAPSLRTASAPAVDEEEETATSTPAVVSALEKSAAGKELADEAIVDKLALIVSYRMAPAPVETAPELTYGDSDRAAPRSGGGVSDAGRGNSANGDGLGQARPSVRKRSTPPARSPSSRPRSGDLLRDPYRTPKKAPTLDPAPRPKPSSAPAGPRPRSASPLAPFAPASPAKPGAAPIPKTTPQPTPKPTPADEPLPDKEEVAPPGGSVTAPRREIAEAEAYSGNGASARSALSPEDQPDKSALMAGNAVAKKSKRADMSTLALRFGVAIPLGLTSRPGPDEPTVVLESIEFNLVETTKTIAIATDLGLSSSDTVVASGAIREEAHVNDIEAIVVYSLTGDVDQTAAPSRATLRIGLSGDNEAPTSLQAGDVRFSPGRQQKLRLLIDPGHIRKASEFSITLTPPTRTAGRK